ncbi:AraC family transcriptional regulator [Pseudomaricurvus sp. HS19]|uniref:AraC family transcriptional regulator n=1 Tax=Pseudomaricurvus sp. HS19 TaxID=2692626 RepID=UPI00136EFBD0|nr:AraC family transcriptional regulator [Pseudomaricurvus sp. HS19]MYM61908.1 helix-turn-helix domain-containing protein [Pseudomaricurvus sp. HS19]
MLTANSTKSPAQRDAFFALEKPLHTLPEISQVRSSNLARFPQLIERLGGDYRALLARFSINARLIEDANSFVDCLSLVKLFEHCAVEFDDPLFGLHLAEQQTADVYGCVVALCRAAATVRDAIACLSEFIPVVHSSESLLELEISTESAPEVAELRWADRSRFANNTQANYQGLLLNLKTLQAVAGPDFRPLHVSVPKGIDGSLVGEFERIVGCPLQAGADYSCIAFPASLLEQPVASANEPLFQLLYGYLFRLKRLPKQTTLERVNVYVAWALGSADLSIDACAKHLGLSARSLQMRLQAIGKSYSDVLENHRQQQARYLLQNDTMSIAELADRLGYAERTSFGRAFKRWTGLTPQQFRRRKAD